MQLYEMKGNVEPTFEQIVLYSKLLKLSLEEDADMLWMAETAYRDLPGLLCFIFIIFRQLEVRIRQKV